MSQLALVPRGFLVPSILRRAAVAPRLSSGRCAAEPLPQAQRLMMTARHPSDETDDVNNSSMEDDDPSAIPVIPDAIGAAAIQEQLDSIKRSEGIRREKEGPGRAAAAAATGASAVAPVASATEGLRRSGAAASSARPRTLWVLIFNHGPRSGAQRGLYCLWSKGFNSVVAFEGRDGALRYAFELKAQGLGLPGPTRVAVKDLQRFCHDHGFQLETVPADVVPVAPDKSKKELGFNPMASSEGRLGRGGNRPYSRFVSEEASPSVFTPQDVREWRAKFERLYSQEEEEEE